jgi:hypothetical protein
MTSLQPEASRRISPKEFDFCGKIWNAGRGQGRAIGRAIPLLGETEGPKAPPGFLLFLHQVRSLLLLQDRFNFSSLLSVTLFADAILSFINPTVFTSTTPVTLSILTTCGGSH